MIYLRHIHEEIAQGSYWQYLGKGWNTLMERNSFVSRSAIKVAAVAGTIFAGGFMGACMTFGTFALLEATNLMKQSLAASIGGHFSEWYALAFFSGLVSKRIPDALSQLGRYERIKEVFSEYLLDTSIPDPQKEAIYREELAYLKSQCKNLLFQSSSFPDTHGIIQFDFPGRLQRDIALQQIYQDIEENLPCSRLKLLSMGWKQEWEIKGKCKMVAIGVAFCGLAALFGTQYAFYALGMGYSGIEAKEAVAHGELPTIGGHILEWLAEMAALADFSIDVVSEFTNIGRSLRMIQLFNEQIENTEDHLLKKRLNQEKKRQFSIFSEGYFFRLPRLRLF